MKRTLLLLSGEWKTSVWKNGEFISSIVTVWVVQGNLRSVGKHWKTTGFSSLKKIGNALLGFSDAFLVSAYCKGNERLSIIHISFTAPVSLTFVDEGKFEILLANNGNNKSSESNTGTIVGSVFGAIGGFLLICCLCNIPR